MLLERLVLVDVGRPRLGVGLRESLRRALLLHPRDDVGKLRRELPRLRSGQFLHACPLGESGVLAHELDELPARVRLVGRGDDAAEVLVEQLQRVEERLLASLDLPRDAGLHDAAGGRRATFLREQAQEADVVRIGLLHRLQPLRAPALGGRELPVELAVGVLDPLGGLDDVGVALLVQLDDLAGLDRVEAALELPGLVARQRALGDGVGRDVAQGPALHPEERLLGGDLHELLALEAAVAEEVVRPARGGALGEVELRGRAGRVDLARDGLLEARDRPLLRDHLVVEAPRARGDALAEGGAGLLGLDALHDVGDGVALGGGAGGEGVHLGLGRKGGAHGAGLAAAERRRAFEGGGFLREPEPLQSRSGRLRFGRGLWRLRNRRLRLRRRLGPSQFGQLLVREHVAHVALEVLRLPVPGRLPRRRVVRAVRRGAILAGLADVLGDLLDRLAGRDAAEALGVAGLVLLGGAAEEIGLGVRFQLGSRRNPLGVDYLDSFRRF